MVEAKDIQRIQEIISKSHGDSTRKFSLARTMANLIKDRDKCYRRFLAAKSILGVDDDVTQVFYRRWHVLNGLGLMAEVPVPPPADEVKEIRKAVPAEDEVFFGSTGPVVGESNPSDAKLKKGKEKGILEIWQSWTLQIIHVFRQGDTPRASIGSVANFQDENGEFLFGGKMLDWTASENVQAAEAKHGKPTETRSYK